MGNCWGEEEYSSEEKNGRTLSMRKNMMREQKNRDVFKYYEVTNNLGEGSLGAVSSARKKVVGGSAYKDSTERGIFSIFKVKKSNEEAAASKSSSEHNREYALKAIQLGRVTDQFLDEMRNEIDILRTLDHPNIVKAYEVFETKRQIFIVMELCSGGDLFARNPYSEKEAAKIIGKILSAVAYMHSKNIVHRDLKFENIMFESRRKDSEIKLIDFGLSKKYLPGSFMTEGVGTIYTMAPQVLQGVYTSQADLWSIGVIAYMLLSSSKPFYHRKRRYVIDKIMRCDYNFNGPNWSHVSKEAKDFVASLLKLNPKERLTAQQALEHKWLSDNFPLSDRRPSEEVMKSIHENILHYGDLSEFKKMALQVIAHKSSTDDIVKMRKAFDQYDSSNDGNITLSEFKVELAKYNYSEEEIEKLFKTVDVNKTGEIHYTEFLACTLEVHGRVEEDRLAEAFDRIDSDDTGYISKKNLEELLGSDRTPELVEQLFKEADFDGDGKITFSEFLRAFRSNNNDLVAQLAHEESFDGDGESTERTLATISTKIPGGA